MEQQPPKKTLLSPKRVNEIADSLDREAFNKFNAARIRLKGESKAEGDKLSDELNKSRMQDESNAARYRSLAVKAVLNKMKK
jgi:hypothetical protein